MSFGLVHANYTLPKWQAVKLTFFAPSMLKPLEAKQAVPGAFILADDSTE